MRKHLGVDVCNIWSCGARLTESLTPRNCNGCAMIVSNHQREKERGEERGEMKGREGKVCGKVASQA